MFPGEPGRSSEDYYEYLGKGCWLDVSCVSGFVTSRMVPKHQGLADFQEAGWWALSSLALVPPHLLPGWRSVLNERGKEVLGTAGNSQGAAKGWVVPWARDLGMAVVRGQAKWAGPGEDGR